MCIFNVVQGCSIAQQHGGVGKIMDVKWVSEYEFVTVGVNHYKFWKFNGENFLSCKKGKFGENFNRVL